MLSALLVTLREGLEAALVVAVMLAYLKRAHAIDRARDVWAGLIAAAAVSVLAGAVLFSAGAELEGVAEELFEGLVGLLATGTLTWMIFWMQRQTRTAGAALRTRVSYAVTAGGSAVFWVAFLAVGREGIETALFLFAAAGGSSAPAVMAGGLAGLAVAAALGVAVYRGGRRLDLATFFKVTSVALLAFAGYLLWGALYELGEMAGSELLEEGTPFLAAAYAIAVLWLYLRPPASLAPGTADPSAR